MSTGYSTIVDCSILEEHLAKPDWRVLDCRFDLFKPSAGRASYMSGHIPGALYVDLEHDLSGPVTATSGRHPLPVSEDFITRIQQWGISPQTQVVVHDGQNGALAARLWWMLRYWLGHLNVAVLNGGMQAWQAGNYPLQTTCQTYQVTDYSPQVDDQTWLGTDMLVNRLANNEIILIDARDTERFAGSVDDPLDKVAGHIPGSLNLPFMANLDQEGKFLLQDALQARFLDLDQIKGQKSLVHSCGSGVTACHNILAMKIAGLGDSYLYPGSWSEWITDPKRAVIREN